MGMKSLLLIFLCLFVSALYAEQETTVRDKKILSVFQVVSFPNDPCTGSGSKNGTCYTTTECSSNGGLSAGSCASGYGVCCTFTLNCGGTSSQNCTYFESSSVTAGGCRAQICPCGTNICRLRLDFNTFVITGPSTSTDTNAAKILNGAPIPNSDGVVASLGTRCLTDTFSVTNPGGSTPPTICGTNTGEHMYVDSSSACNELAFQLGTTGVGATLQTTRSWSIKVTQLDCNSPVLAPSGCTQYFYGSDTGTFQSYNYNNGNGLHLANQNQNICFRKERGNCRICYATSAVTDFSVSGMTDAGIIDTCCGYGADGKKSNFDCLQIPSATKQADKAIIEGAAGFCGQKGLVSVASAAAPAATICSMRTPFQVRFITDGFELNNENQMVATMNPDKGFTISYTMSC